MRSAGAPKITICLPTQEEPQIVCATNDFRVQVEIFEIPSNSWSSPFPSDLVLSYFDSLDNYPKRAIKCRNLHRLDSTEIYEPRFFLELRHTRLMDTHLSLPRLCIYHIGLVMLVVL